MHCSNCGAAFCILRFSATTATATTTTGPFRAYRTGEIFPGRGVRTLELAPYSPYLELVALINAARLHTQLLLFRTLCMAKSSPAKNREGGNPRCFRGGPRVFYSVLEVRHPKLLPVVVAGSAGPLLLGFHRPLRKQASNSGTPII